MKKLSVALVAVSALVALPAAAADKDKKPAASSAASPVAAATAATAPAATAAAPGDAGKSAAPVDDQHLPDVVATVNGVNIKKGDLQNQVEMLKMQMSAVGQQVPSEQHDQMYRDMLEDLIDTELLSQEASTRKIPVADGDVEKLYSEFKGRFPTEEVFQRQIKDQGLTEVDIRNEIKKHLQIKALLDKEVMSKITVDDAAVAKFYKDNPDKFQEPEKVRASHILVLVKDSDDAKTKADKKALADKIAKDATGGADFAGLAKQYSEDPGSKDKGGDLDYFPRGVMEKTFEDAAFGGKVGSIVGPIQTKYGWHVLKIVDHKSAQMVPLNDDVKQDITEFLKENKATELAKVYVDGLKSKAKIKTYI